MLTVPLSSIRAAAVYREDAARWPDIEAKVRFRVGRRRALTDASNTAPIVLTAAGHGFAEEELVSVEGVTGNLAANGAWVLGAVTADTVALLGSSGNGAYAGGGELVDLVAKHLGAIVAALDALGDGTVAIAGGREGLDYSQSRDREALVLEALAALYTSSEDAASGAFAFGQRGPCRCERPPCRCRGAFFG